MIIFDFLMTIIEVYNLTYFNCKINHIKFNIFTMLLVPFLCIFMIFFFNYYILNNFLLLLVLLLVNFIVACYMHRRVSIYFFLIPTILIVLLAFSNTISLIFSSLFLGVIPQDIMIKQEYIVTLSLLSRIIYMSLSYAFYNIERKLNVNTKKVLQNNFWVSFCVFSTTFLGLHTILYEAVFYNFINHKTIYKLLIMLIVMGILFFIFFIKMQKEYINFVKVNDELVKNKYQEENLKKIKKFSYEVYFEKHRIYYDLLKIKSLITHKKITEAVEFIDKKINDLNSTLLFQTSHHNKFDLHVIEYIKNMRRKGYDVKFIMSVENNELLDNEEVIFVIKDYLEYFFNEVKKEKMINIQINEQDQYLILKMNTPSQIKIENYKQDKQTEFLRKVNIKCEKDITEIDLLFRYMN